MGKEIIVSKKKNIGHNDRDEYVDYSLQKRVAKITMSNGKKVFEEYDDKSRFELDIKSIVTLAKKEIPILEEKIQNNKRVIALSEGNQIELDKANRHLSINQQKLDFVTNFIETGGKV